MPPKTGVCLLLYAWHLLSTFFYLLGILQFFGSFSCYIVQVARLFVIPFNSSHKIKNITTILTFSTHEQETMFHIFIVVVVVVVFTFSSFVTGGIIQAILTGSQSYYTVVFLFL